MILFIRFVTKFNFHLITKLHFVTQLVAKFNFAKNHIPKFNLETSRNY